jgi:hypothetical protein
MKNKLLGAGFGTEILSTIQKNRIFCLMQEKREGAAWFSGQRLSVAIDRNRYAG